MKRQTKRKGKREKEEKKETALKTKSHPTAPPPPPLKKKKQKTSISFGVENGEGGFWLGEKFSYFVLKALLRCCLKRSLLVGYTEDVRFYGPEFLDLQSFVVNGSGFLLSPSSPESGLIEFALLREVLEDVLHRMIGAQDYGFASFDGEGINREDARIYDPD